MSGTKNLAVAAVLLCMAAAVQAEAAPSGFAAKFVESRTLPNFGTPLISHGVMRFSKETGFHWEILAPYHYVFEMNDGRATEVLPDGSKRKLDPREMPWLAAVEHIFVSALSGDHSDLKRYFKVEIEPLPGGQTGRHVSLIPRPGAMASVIDRIEITEAAPGQPESLQIDEAAGGQMHIRFTPIQPADR